MNVEEILKTEKRLPLENRTILHLLLVRNHAYDRVTQALKPFQISLQQFNVLRILRGQKGKPANLSTINERMVDKKSNTTRLVDKLISKDLVERITCKTNRRKVEITLTDKGEIALAKMDRAVHLAERELLKKLNRKDMEQLNLLLDKF